MAEPNAPYRKVPDRDAVASLELRLHRILRRWPNDDPDKQTFYRLVDLARAATDQPCVAAGRLIVCAIRNEVEV